MVIMPRPYFPLLFVYNFLKYLQLDIFLAILPKLTDSQAVKVFIKDLQSMQRNIVCAMM